LDKDRPVTSIKTVEKQMEESHMTPKSQSVLLGIFGGLGFALAIVGVYGVMSYVVSQQTREIGIRMALGANRQKVLVMVIVHGLKLTLGGVLIGVGVSLALTRFMRSQLPDGSGYVWRCGHVADCGGRGGMPGSSAAGDACRPAGGVAL
jgi:putative ABC transport system permease protein